MQLICAAVGAVTLTLIVVLIRRALKHRAQAQQPAASS
jgi:hypothetical protein